MQGKPLLMHNLYLLMENRDTTENIVFIYSALPNDTTLQTNMVWTLLKPLQLLTPRVFKSKESPQKAHR